MRHVEFFCHLPDSVTSALGATISQCLAFFSFFPFSFPERFGNTQGDGGKFLKHFKRHFGKLFFGGGAASWGIFFSFSFL